MRGESPLDRPVFLVSPVFSSGPFKHGRVGIFKTMPSPLAKIAARIEIRSDLSLVF